MDKTDIIRILLLLFVSGVIAFMIFDYAYAEEFTQAVWIAMPDYDTGYRWFIAPLHIVDKFPDEILNHPEYSGHGKGITYKGHIWILSGYEGVLPTYGGCSILWHEILHIKGWTHKMMRENASNFDCAVMIGSGNI